MLSQSLEGNSWVCKAIVQQSDGLGKKKKTLRGSQHLLFWDKPLRKFVCILVSVAIHTPQQTNVASAFQLMGVL